MVTVGLKTQMWPVIDVPRSPGEKGADVVKTLPVSGSTAMPSGWKQSDFRLGPKF